MLLRRQEREEAQGRTAADEYYDERITPGRKLYSSLIIVMLVPRTGLRMLRALGLPGSSFRSVANWTEWKAGREFSSSRDLVPPIIGWRRDLLQLLQVEAPMKGKDFAARNGLFGLHQ